MALQFPVGAGARTGSGLADPEEAVHAAARRGRGEASSAEPFDRARVLAFCLRVGVGVRAAHAVFVVTLGTVSCSDRAFPEAIGRGEFKGWPLQSYFVATVYAARGPYTRLK